VAAEIVSAAREQLLYQVTAARLNLTRAMLSRTEHVKLLLAQFKPDSILQNLTMYTQRYNLRLAGARDDVADGIGDMLTRLRHRLELGESEVASRSPLEVLRRGYAVVRKGPKGAVLRDVGEVLPSDRLTIRLYKGRLTAEVLETHGEDQDL
jgi:exonuclease VII large subunit